MNGKKAGNDEIKSKTYMRNKIVHWRKERQSRLMEHVLHRRDGTISSAVIGSATTANKETTQKNKSDCTASVPNKGKAAPSASSKNVKQKEKPSSTATVPKVKPITNRKLKPKNVPEIKHTLASKLRLIKANPLLEARGIITVPEKYKKALDRGFIKERLQIQRNEPFIKTTSLQQSTGSHMSNRLTLQERQSKRNNDQMPRERPPMMRRSRSADEHSRKSAVVNQEEHIMKRNHSVEDLQGLGRPLIAEEDLEDGIHPLPITPNVYQTPQRPRSTKFFNTSGRKSMVSPSTLLTPPPTVMRQELSDWLKKRGRSLSSFQHLHCFGLHASKATSDLKPRYNFASKRINIKGSQMKSVTEEVNTPLSGPSTLIEENKENIGINTSAEDALEDLKKVILFGYPSEQCRSWLIEIRKSFPEVKEVPVYWECLAALEEARGDFKSAVDCYERAIIRGASPDKVSNSLDQLMEKFNLLNLKTDQKDEGSNKLRHKQVLDARDVFKSTIIKFALQQKAVRSLGTNLGMSASSLNYVVTPVRRSTRALSSRYSLTPGVLCVKSLNDLESNVRKSMIFKPNYALD